MQNRKDRVFFFSSLFSDCVMFLCLNALLCWCHSHILALICCVLVFAFFFVPILRFVMTMTRASAEEERIVPPSPGESPKTPPLPEAVPVWTLPPRVPVPARLVQADPPELPMTVPLDPHALPIFQDMATEAAHFGFPPLLPSFRQVPVLPLNLCVLHYLHPAMRPNEWWSGTLPLPPTPAQLLTFYGRELRFWESHSLCSYLLTLPPTAVAAHKVNDFFIHFALMEAYICFGTPFPTEEQLASANTPEGHARHFAEMSKYFPLEFLLLMDWSPFDQLRFAFPSELKVAPSMTNFRHTIHKLGILCSIPAPNPSLVNATGRTLLSLAADVLQNSFLNAQRIAVAS